METREVIPPPPVKTDKGTLTRIYVEANGDVVVTDLWEELRSSLLSPERGFHEKD